jgi:capsular polysaccharide biosynthesis protein
MAEDAREGKEETLAVDGVQVPRASGLDEYEVINPLDLPRMERAELFSRAVDGIYLEGAGKTRKFHRYGAAFVDDPDQVGLFSGGIGVQPYWYPPAYTAGISNATLVGYRTILTPNKQFFTDEAYAEPEFFQHRLRRISRSDSFSNEATGLRPTDRERYFEFDPGDRASRHVEGNVVVLSSDEPFSYGSFLFRVVPKAKAIRDLGLIDTTSIAYASQEPFMDLLNLCGISKETIQLHDINAVTRIDRAIIPCLRNPHAYLDPESCELYAELRARYGERPTGRKVYVSRLSINEEGWSTRIMANEGELIARLETMGFDIIEPEHLSVREQIRTFSSASMIVGPSGSGLFNTMFCHPGTKVIDIQSEPQWIYSYTGMYSSLKLEYGIFVGKADPTDTKEVHRRWTVNIDALITRIQSFLSE